MEYGFLSRAGKFLQEQRKHRRWMMMFLCLAGGVTLGTLAFLKLYGQAMTHQVKMLDCQYEVHAHTEDCYEENEDGEEVLICGYADYVIHVHNDDCYDQKGNLVCPLEEHELHEHDDDCWEEEDVLICGEGEVEGSTEESETKTAESKETAETSKESQDEEKESGSDAVTGRELACEKEEHKHDDSCYDGGSGCDLEEHAHNDGCYEKTETLVCEESEHTHDDGCYTEVESGPACGESEHEHGDGCYDEEGELTCEKDEHSHNGDCYEVTRELTCGTDEHTHGGGCYEVTETLACEIKEHEHDDGCEADSELICKIEEHEHDDSCYIETKAEMEKKETSKAVEEVKEEVEKAATDDGKEADKGHTYTDDCYKTEEVLTCGELELHTHDDSCYDEDCFDEDGNLIEGSRVSCGLLQLEEHIHTEECFQVVELTPEEVAALNGGATLHVHSDECYDENGNLICGHEVTHMHQLECYDEDGNLICGFDMTEETHEHDLTCYDEEGNLICGYEDAKDHEHDETCYDEDGNLICGYVTEEEKEYENVKVYEGESYIVTVRYDDDAEIPEEAELVVEEMTSESHEEHYASREAEYRELVEDEMASMKALLKIGFYVEAEEEEEKTEIEPKTPVTVAVQFLNGEGLPEGRAVTVIYFADDGVEMLDGGRAADNSTTFTMESFSEIAIGYISEEKQKESTFYLSESFGYEDDALQITLHVEGEANLLEDTANVLEKAEETEVSKALKGVEAPEDAEE